MKYAGCEPDHDAIALRNSSEHGAGWPEDASKCQVSGLGGNRRVVEFDIGSPKPPQRGLIMQLRRADQDLRARQKEAKPALAAKSPVAIMTPPPERRAQVTVAGEDRRETTRNAASA